MAGFPNLLGDASYAIYLSHGFVITFMSIVLARLHCNGVLALVAGFFGCTLLAVAAGIVVHQLIEQSLIHKLRYIISHGLQRPVCSKGVA